MALKLMQISLQSAQIYAEKCHKFEAKGPITNFEDFRSFRRLQPPLKLLKSTQILTDFGKLKPKLPLFFIKLITHFNEASFLTLSFEF